jgi:hypothetical protein
MHLERDRFGLPVRWFDRICHCSSNAILSFFLSERESSFGRSGREKVRRQGGVKEHLINESYWKGENGSFSFHSQPSRVEKKSWLILFSTLSSLFLTSTFHQHNQKLSLSISLSLFLTLLSSESRCFDGTRSLACLHCKS